MMESEDLDWHSLEQLYDEGRALFTDGRYQEAIDCFKRVYANTFALGDVAEVVEDHYNLPSQEWIAKYRTRFQR